MHTSGLSEVDRGQRLSGKLPAPLRRLARWYSDWNYGWQADIALRYVPVANALTSRPQRSRKTSEVFLDVGCGSKGGVTSYVPVRTVGVDLAFNVGRIRRHPAVTPVIGLGSGPYLWPTQASMWLCAWTHSSTCRRLIGCSSSPSYSESWPATAWSSSAHRAAWKLDRSNRRSMPATGSAPVATTRGSPNTSNTSR